MSKAEENSNHLTDSEKVEFLNHLKGKGEKPGAQWTLIHSELCNIDEADLDHTELIASLSNQKFFIPTISSPNEKSFEDKGNVKVRYRYVLNAANRSERKIESNTREFCAALIRRDLIYRREDINFMSFRGINPIATRNYSIFQLQGHWNCRHAWQREIYIVAEDAKRVESGTLTDKKVLLMSKETKTFREKFGAFLTGLGEKLTKEEIVEATKQMFGEHTFIDIKVGDNTLRIDGDAVEEGAAVSWVDAEENLTEVPDGDLKITIDGKDMILVIENRVIKEVKEAESAEATEEELSEKNKTEVKEGVTKAEFDEFKKSLPEIIKEAVGEKFSDVEKMVDAKIAGKPAFEADKIKVTLSEAEGKNDKEQTRLEKMVLGKN